MYIEKKPWDKHNEVGLAGEGSLRGENNYGNDCGIFVGLFLTLKIKICLTFDKNVVIEEHKTPKGMNNVQEKLDKKEYFKMLNGVKIIAKVPLSWKHSFDSGILIPHKQRYCSDCENGLICDKFDKLLYQTKKFPANMDELKSQTPNSIGLVLPWCIDDLDEYCIRRNN